MTRRDIERVIEKIPSLTDNGIITVMWHGRDAEEFRERQESLKNSSEECTKVCAWLADIKKIKTINRLACSYRLKHIVEKEVGYISNGEFIAAAVHCGFTYRLHSDNPNVWFAMSEKLILKKDPEPF
jgi:hypothetical protein